jgi:predicted GIY-YIG superfamily endonuclease
MKGWVYILTNSSFDDIKIGYSNNPERRVKELSKSTSAPSDFVIAYKHECADEHRMYNLESAVHTRLDEHRPNKGKEFFNCSVEKAIKTIKSVDDDLQRGRDNHKHDPPYPYLSPLSLCRLANADKINELCGIVVDKAALLGEVVESSGMTSEQVQEALDSYLEHKNNR